MNKSQKQIGELVKNFSKYLKSEKSAIFNLSSFKSIEIQKDFFRDTYTIEDNIESSKYDLIFVDLPFGMNRVSFSLNPTKKINKNWELLLNSLHSLNSKGFCLAVIEPIIYSSIIGKYFLEELGKIGYHCNILLNAPNKLYYPQSSFTPVIIGIEKIPKEKLFIGELSLENSDKLVHNFLDNTSENIENGKFVERSEFSTIERAKIEVQIEGLKTQYKDYKQYKLIDVIEAINSTREIFEERPNSLYLQKIGKLIPFTKIEDVKVKHQNVFQIELNRDIILSEYLALFYQSELGQLILNSNISGTFIPKLTKKTLEESYLAVPSINEQNTLIHTNLKLSELQETVNELKKELSLNPKNAGIILDKFDSIYGPLKKLNSEDEILSIIRKGENKTIEFKQTFSKNIHTTKKDKEIEKASLKNIVGFLNAEGGTLLIGVADNGEVTGIEEDIFKTADKYLLNFKNALKTKIGSEFYPLLNFDIFQVMQKLVLRVDCQASKKPCFYDGNEFYVRTNPATDKLEGRQLIEYVKRRFEE